MNFWKKLLLNQAIITITGLLQEGVLDEKIRRAIKPSCIRARDLINAVFPDEPPLLSPVKANKAIKSFKPVV